MRLQCEARISRCKPKSQQPTSNTKPRKAFVVLQRLRQTPPQYQITVAVVGDKTGNKFELNKPPLILDRFVNDGRATITFQLNPAVMLYINKAKPDELARLIDYIKRISKGESVDVEKVKIKNSDFKPTTIHVKSQKEYKTGMANCSEFLRTLQIDPIDLRMPDVTWKKCENITKLSISGNPIGNRTRNLDVFGKLLHLQVLEIKNCALGALPLPALCDMFKELPITLTTIDIGQNQLEIFPPMFHLKQLRIINAAHNLLKYLPSRIGVLQNLNTIDLSHNCMHSLPYIFLKIANIQHVGINSNDDRLAVIINDIGPLGVYQLHSKIDQLEYSHDGGVDSLMTIAANAIHRKECRDSRRVGRQIFPLSLRFQMDDLIYEKPGVSALELCTDCLLLRHIRYVRQIVLPSRQIANSVDVIDRFVHFNQLLCIDCYRKKSTTTAAKLPVLDNFFLYSI